MKPSTKLRQAVASDPSRVTVAKRSGLSRFIALTTRILVSPVVTNSALILIILFELFVLICNVMLLRAVLGVL